MEQTSYSDWKPGDRLRRMEQFAIEKAHTHHENSWWMILGIYFFYAILIAIVVFILYPYEIIRFIHNWTQGLLNETLIASIFVAVVIIYFCIVNIAHQSWESIGFDIPKLFPGIIMTLLLWIMLNVIVIISSLVYQGSLTLAKLWQDYPVTIGLGLFLAQILGVAIQEEGMFRGYLLIQIEKKMNRFWPGKPRLSVFVTMLITNTLFSIMHIPIRILTGVSGWALIIHLAILVGMGVIFSFIYLLTENLWFTMGIHALNNAMTLIFQPTLSENLIYIIFVCIVVLMVYLWPQIRKMFPSTNIQSEV